MWSFALNVPLGCWHIDKRSSEVPYQWMSAFKMLLQLYLRSQNCTITVLTLTVLPISPFHQWWVATWNKWCCALGCNWGFAGVLWPRRCSRAIIGWLQPFWRCWGRQWRHNWQRQYNAISENAGVALPRDRFHSYNAAIGATRATPLPLR